MFVHHVDGIHNCDADAMWIQESFRLGESWEERLRMSVSPSQDAFDSIIFICPPQKIVRISWSESVCGHRPRNNIRHNVSENTYCTYCTFDITTTSHPQSVSPLHIISFEAPRAPACAVVSAQETKGRSGSPWTPALRFVTWAPCIFMTMYTFATFRYDPRAGRAVTGSRRRA